MPSKIDGFNVGLETRRLQRRNTWHSRDAQSRTAAGASHNQQSCSLEEHPWQQHADRRLNNCSCTFGSNDNKWNSGSPTYRLNQSGVGIAYLTYLEWDLIWGGLPRHPLQEPCCTWKSSLPSQASERSQHRRNLNWKPKLSRTPFNPTPET